LTFEIRRGTKIVSNPLYPPVLIVFCKINIDKNKLICHYIASEGGKSLKLKIGENLFNSKKEAIFHYKKILFTHKLKDILTENETEELKELLKNHPDYEKKIGSGIKFIFTDSDGFGKGCFWIMRTDNTRIDFSFYTCINGKKSVLQDFEAACRHSVTNFIIDFKNKNGIVKDKTEHVDHEPPLTFSKIVDNFIKEKSIDLTKIEYDNSSTMTFFKDKNLEKDFYEYHKSVCKLRIISAKENLKNSYKGRRNVNTIE
jgi:hypothetical protein